MEINSSGYGVNDSLLSVEEELAALGPVAQTILVTLYSLTSFLALIGNVLVIMVELYGRRSARNLQKFLINLAIADLLIGVLSTPFIYTDFMLGRWIFHPLLCPIAQFVQLISVFVSTYTLTFIGIERYFVTLHPLSSANTWLRSHCNLVLLIGWIIGAVVSSASIPYTRAEKVDTKMGEETYYKCKHADGPSQDMKIYTLLLFVLTFALPMLLLSISYGAIGRRLLRTQHHWCSFKQTTPFSTSRTQQTNHNHHTPSASGDRSHSGTGLRGSAIGAAGNSSISDSHQSASIPLVGGGGGHGGDNPGSDPADVAVNGGGDGGTESSKPFVKCKITRQSTKSKSSNNRSANKDHKDNNNNKDSSDKESSKGSTGTGKVFIQFDRRNTEFLNKMRVFRLLVAILVLFIICWLPIKLFMLAITFFPSITDVHSIFAANLYYITFFVCHLLSMANSFANPVLYCFMSKSFRADLMDLLACISTKLNLSNSISRNYDYKLQQKQFAYNAPNEQFGANAKELAFQQDYQYLHHGRGFHRFGQSRFYTHHNRNGLANSRLPGGAAVNGDCPPGGDILVKNSHHHRHHWYTPIPQQSSLTPPKLTMPSKDPVIPVASPTAAHVVGPHPVQTLMSNGEFVSNTTTSSSSQYYSDSMNEFASCSSSTPNSSNLNHPNETKSRLHRHHHSHSHLHRHHHRHHRHKQPHSTYLDYLQDNATVGGGGINRRNRNSAQMTTTSDGDDELTRELNSRNSDTETNDDDVDRCLSKEMEKIPFEIVPLDSF